MTWKTPVKGWACALALVLLQGYGAGGEVMAAPPKITEIMPFGIRRGEPAKIRINGTDLASNPRLIAPFAHTVNAKPDVVKGSDAAHWTPELTVSPGVPIGVYPVRIQTDDGISNPFLFAVGQLPQISEKEDNNAFDAPQVLASLPVVVEGTLQGNDVDYFRISGKKGQRIVIDAQCARIGSGVDPVIRLTKANAERAYVATADESPGLMTDCRVSVALPDDGDYIVELSDSRYQGGGRPVYRLVVGSVPLAEELFPLGAREGETVGVELRGGTVAPQPDAFTIAALTPKRTTATHWYQPRIADPRGSVAKPGEPTLDVESLGGLIVGKYPEMREAGDGSLVTKGAAPVVFNGRIGRPGEVDHYKLAVAPNDRLRISVQAASLGSTLDGTLQIVGNGGAVIANADDQTVPGPPKNGQPTSIIDPDPSLDLTVPGGTTEVTLNLKDLEGRGGVGFSYRIVVEPIVPTFTLTVADSQISIPKGGTALLPLTLVRAGFNDAVTVTVVDPPAGLTVRPALIAAGQLVGALSLQATADASFNASPLKLVGRGQSGATVVESEAKATVDFALQDGVPINSLVFKGIEAAPALAEPVNLTSPAEPVEIAHGYEAAVNVEAVRAKGSDAALTLSPAPLPPGLTIANATIAEKATKGTVTVKAAAETPFGTMTVGLLAKGKLANVDRTFAVPVVTLKMVRPAELQLATAALEVKPGATFELKGKIIRKGGFKEPVTLKINGLPAGLTAAPITVAPDKTDFSVNVVADAKAAAATAKAQAAISYQVNKKDYPVPPTDLAVKVLTAK